jgi:hypothetical protein
VKSDQRGFLINGVVDAGAGDFQGAADLKRWWNTDWDGDGVRFGVEFATGRDPNAATGDSPLNLVPHPHSLTEPGTHALVFNVGSLARQYGVKWVISSSFALSDFFSAVGWVSYDYTPPSTYSVNPSALFGFNWVIPSASSPTVRLKLTPNLSRAFFRLEAELP